MKRLVNPRERQREIARSPNAGSSHQTGRTAPSPHADTSGEPAYLAPRGRNLHERLLTPADLAKRWRMSTSWLAKKRMSGDGPAFVRIGRSIRYRESAVEAWERARQRLSTSER